MLRTLKVQIKLILGIRSTAHLSLKVGYPHTWVWSISGARCPGHLATVLCDDWELWYICLLDLELCFLETISLISQKLNFWDKMFVKFLMKRQIKADRVIVASPPFFVVCQGAHVIWFAWNSYQNDSSEGMVCECLALAEVCSLKVFVILVLETPTCFWIAFLLFSPFLDSSL